MSLHDAMRDIYRWRCKHGERIRCCIACFDEAREAEEVSKRALQAMHELMVWMFCNGLSSVSDIYLAGVTTGFELKAARPQRSDDE